MQVFIPYPEPMKVAQAMWADQKRYNKQIIECQQIISAIDGEKAWKNHPVCLMYKKHKDWLKIYLWCFEAYRNSMKSDNCTNKDGFMMEAEYFNEKANLIKPPFITDELCDQHKRRLFCKAPELYPQFAEYGKSEVNYYYVDGKLLKYKNGKQIKE